MQAELTIHSKSFTPTELELADGETLISLKVPSDHAVKVAETIKSVLGLAGHKVRHVNRNGEELVNSRDVFANVTPGAKIRGLRTKEGITQVEFAVRLGITQNMVSDMESGRRNISLNMAKRIAEEFKVPYNMFL